MNDVLFERLREFGKEAGFIPSMATDILLVMLKKGLNGESYE